MTTVPLTTIHTTIQTVNNTKENNEKNDYWLKYTFIVGIAAAVLVICTVIAIVTSRYKSLRKAKAQYKKEQMRAKQEIEKQKRESRSRTLSTTVSIQDPFFIYPYAYEATDRVSPFDDVFVPADGLVTGTIKRNPFVQVIPSFSTPIDAPIHDKLTRQLDITPPPRLSPSFQGSDERIEALRVPARRHSLQSELGAFGPPVLLPREPIPQPKRSRRHSHQSLPRKTPLTKKRSHSTSEIYRSNYGYIPEETEPHETITSETSLPSPDYE